MGVECIQGVFFTDRAVEELSKLQTTEEYRMFLPFIAVSMKYQCAVCHYDSDALLKIAQHLVDAHVSKNELPPMPPEGQPYLLSAIEENKLSPIDQGGQKSPEAGLDKKKCVPVNGDTEQNQQKHGEANNASSEDVKSENNENKTECKSTTTLKEKEENTRDTKILNPLKKKRVGRPPKKRNTEDEVVTGKVSPEVFRAARTRSKVKKAIESESTELPKKKRGRPPKKSSAEQNKSEMPNLASIIPKKRPIKDEVKEMYSNCDIGVSKDGTQGNCTTNESKSENEEELPEKEENTSKADAQETDEEWQIEMEEDEEEDEEDEEMDESSSINDTANKPVKKKKGRPPGSKNKGNINSGDTEEKAKKKIGRPRKYVSKPDRDGLTRHEREDVKARTCALCGILIPCLEDVMEHYKVEHGYVPKPFHEVLPQPAEKIPQDSEQMSGKKKKFTSTTEQCKFCGKMFLKDNIKKHIILKHVWKRIQRREQRKQEVLCYICGKVFQHIQNLERHVAEHLGRVKKRERVNQTFVCDVCGYTTPENSRLKKHYMAKHQGLSPYQCVQCEYQTWERSSFRCHMFRHQDSKKYRCMEINCSYQCIQKKQLRAHLKRHHGVDLPKVYGKDTNSNDNTDPEMTKVNTPPLDGEYTDEKGAEVPSGEQGTVEYIISQEVPSMVVEQSVDHPLSQDMSVVEQVVLTSPPLQQQQQQQPLGAPSHSALTAQALPISSASETPTPTILPEHTLVTTMSDNILVTQQLQQQHQQLQVAPLQHSHHILQPLIPPSQTSQIVRNVSQDAEEGKTYLPTSSAPGAFIGQASHPNIISIQVPPGGSDTNREHNMASLMTFASAAAAVAGLGSTEECSALEQDIARALIQINPMSQQVMQTLQPATLDTQNINHQQ